jgi:hypothetical protein
MPIVCCQARQNARHRKRTQLIPCGNHGRALCSNARHQSHNDSETRQRTSARPALLDQLEVRADVWTGFARLALASQAFRLVSISCQGLRDEAFIASATTPPRSTARSSS